MQPQFPPSMVTNRSFMIQLAVSSKASFWLLGLYNLQLQKYNACITAIGNHTNVYQKNSTFTYIISFNPHHNLIVDWKIWPQYFLSSLIKKWIFPIPLHLNWPCGFLWPTEYGGSDTVWLPRLGIKRSCSFLLYHLRCYTEMACLEEVQDEKPSPI